MAVTTKLLTNFTFSVALKSNVCVSQKLSRFDSFLGKKVRQIRWVKLLTEGISSNYACFAKSSAVSRRFHRDRPMMHFLCAFCKD